MVAMVTAADTLPTATAGAVHTTADTVGVTDGIMTDGVTVADGVMRVTSLLVVMADSAMMADLVTVADSGMVAAGSRIQDMAAEAIAADPTGHRISRTVVCREISRIVTVM
jgi:hypothetical protein